MVTISVLVDRYVRETPFLEEGLAQGIINLSALARHFRPRLERELLKPASDAAVMMALKRLTPRVLRKRRREEPLLRRMGDLTLRSGLQASTFRQSPTIIDAQRRLLHRSRLCDGAFLTFTQGVREAMVIASSSLARDVGAAFHHEQLLDRLDDLSAVVIQLPEQTVQTPGIYHSILKQLAWRNLNVIDVVSTRTEFTILVEKRQVERAFAVLRQYVWP